MYVNANHVYGDLPDPIDQPDRGVAVPADTEQPAFARAAGVVLEVVGALIEPETAAEVRGFVGGWFRDVVTHARRVRAEVAADTLVRAVGAALLAGARHVVEKLEAAAQEAGDGTTNEG